MAWVGHCHSNSRVGPQPPHAARQLQAPLCHAAPTSQPHRWPAPPTHLRLKKLPRPPHSTRHPPHAHPPYHGQRLPHQSLRRHRAQARRRLRGRHTASDASRNTASSSTGSSGSGSSSTGSTGSSGSGSSRSSTGSSGAVGSVHQQRQQPQQLGAGAGGRLLPPRLGGGHSAGDQRVGAWGAEGRGRAALPRVRPRWAHHIDIYARSRHA